jgi:hypothetical protein
MKFTFSEDLKYLFPYWVVGEVLQKDDNFNRMMDIQEWLITQFGAIGEDWGFEKHRGTMPTGGAAYNLRNSPLITYSWRFKKKADAMLFKLTWSV